MLVHRGQHRFRAPLDYRYQLYPVPSVADTKCPKCGERCAFAVAPREAFIQDAQSGGYSPLALSIEGPLAGVGACASGYAREQEDQQSLHAFALSSGRTLTTRIRPACMWNSRWQ